VSATCSSNSHKRRQVAVDTEWDPNNLFSIARFLTISRLLTEFNVERIESDPSSSGIRMRVYVGLQATYAKIEDELLALDLRSKESRYSVVTIEGPHMTAQCEVMQIYISMITTNWVSKTVAQFGSQNLHERFVFWDSRYVYLFVLNIYLQFVGRIDRTQSPTDMLRCDVYLGAGGPWCMADECFALVPGYSAFLQA
jgi:hypothetical protein